VRPAQLGHDETFGGDTVASAVDGLVSGLSTTSLISQLMQVESQGQAKLQSKVKSQQTVIAAYQAINARFATLTTNADALTNDTMAELPLWQPAAATSSSDAIKATASAGATTGEFTFDVKYLAKSHVINAKVAGTGSIQDGTGVAIRINGGDPQPITVSPTADTAQGVADAINAAKLGVTATVITTTQGSVLQLAATETGAAKRFTLEGVTIQQPSWNTVSNGQDAEIHLPGGYSVTSATNTFSGVMPNLTLTATKVEDGVTVAVRRDADGLANKMQAMIDSVNNVLTDIATQGRQKNGSVSAGPLAGQFAVRKLGGDVLSVVSQGHATLGSFKDYGVELTKDGKVTFDRTKFVEAYNKNPAAAETAISGGLAKSFKDLGTTAKVGLEALIQGGNTMVTNLNDQIASWDVRLSTRRKALERQYGNLEVTLGNLKNQSSWLSGQLASLG
jgi:flagellar hook-associated protein 2